MTRLRCTDFTCTLKSCLCPIVAKCLVRIECTLFIANLPGLFGNKRRGEGEGLASRSGCKILRLLFFCFSRELVNTRTEKSPYRRVALLSLARLAWEHDEALLVRLQTLDIDRLPFDGEISAPMVDYDAQSQCGLAADTGLLQLSKSKATTLA